MPPSKTQAQKRAEREARIAEKADARAMESTEKKTKYQQQYGSKSSDEKPKERKPWELSDDDDCQLERTKFEKCNVDERRSKLASWQKTKQQQELDHGPCLQLSTKHEESARLVMNHSTHCDELIPVLRRLCHKLDSRFTITPGVIFQNQSNRNGVLVIDMRRSNEDTCFNLLAKRGSTIQEVFIQKPADYDKEKLFFLVQTCVDHVREACEDDYEIPVLNNHELAELTCHQEMNERKAQHQQAHLNTQQCDRERKEADAEHKRSKRLQGKVGREAAANYAGRDEAIVNGDTRGKRAM